MADLTIEVKVTVPNGVTAIQFRDGVARERNYPETVTSIVDEEEVQIPNPESKVDYIKRLTGNGWVAAYEADAVKVAAQTVRDANEAAREGFVVS